jgi:hypothetical protein
MLGMAIGISLGAGATTTVVRDWGLHREWRVENDPAHPERPARLVEVPWNLPVSTPGTKNPAGEPSRPAAEPHAPMVRAGMRVTVWRRGAEAEIHIAGTALEGGNAGRIIRVRAGLSNAMLRGIVRGPGSVELLPGKGWR